jgi:hypothetical protein
MKAGKIPRHERIKFPDKRKKTPRAEEEPVTLHADSALTDAAIPLQKKTAISPPQQWNKKSEAENKFRTEGKIR